MRSRRALWAEVGWTAALVIATAASPVALLGSFAVLVLPVCALLAGFAGRWLVSLRTAVVAMAGATIAAVLVATQADPGRMSSQGVSIVLLALVGGMVPWWIGRTRRLRVEQTAREQLLADQRGRLSERNRIARDMHDSLGHDLALIALRAGAWELAADASPEQQAAAAEVRTGATAATERLHGILGVLGESPDGPSGGSTDIDAVVERARKSGVEVELRRDDHRKDEWSPDVARAAHGVVQESITNAIKHAPGSRITVTIADHDDEVTIKVINSRGSSHGDPSVVGGQGLVGLDERLRLLGGRLVAGPGADGFSVRATLPRQALVGRDMDPAPAGTDALARLRHQGRRRRMRAALLPGLLAIALGVTLFVVHAITVTQTALAPTNYGQLTVGQHRSEIAGLLPPRTQSSPPPILAVPAAPADSRCDFYQARASVFDFTSDMFRLCFANGQGDPTLVSKDHLRPRGER